MSSFTYYFFCFFQALLGLLLLFVLNCCNGQQLKLFPGKYFTQSQRIYTDPDLAYRLRARYAEKNGPYGEHFIANVSLRNFLKIAHETSNVGLTSYLGRLLNGPAILPCFVLLVL